MSTTEYIDDKTNTSLKNHDVSHGISISKPKDMKFDQEKPIAGALKDFNLALIELAKLMTLGAKKYERSSWLTVPDAEQRYYDGLWRHILELDDVEGDLGHDVAVVFNALAVLQLRLLREKRDA